MAYMSVLSKTETKLRLLREPSFLSKTVFIGFIVGVLGIFIYGPESCILKMVIGLCVLFLSSCIIDNFEICEIDKELDTMKLTKLHWCQYLLDYYGLYSSHHYVTIKVGDIQDVSVQELYGIASRKDHQVVFNLDSGIKLGATEVFTSDPVSDHEQTVAVIRSFLNIPNPSASQEDIDYEGDGSSSSDDDDIDMEGFEQISNAEIKDLEEESKQTVGDVISNTNDDASAAAACAVDDHGDGACPDVGVNAAASS